MLKSKLRKLVPWKKRRDKATGTAMGNCVGSANEKTSATKSEVSNNNNYTHGQLVLK